MGKMNEKDRCGKYITSFGEIETNQFRKIIWNSKRVIIDHRSSLVLYFQPSDPKPLQSQYGGTGDNVKQIPMLASS